MFKGSVLHIDGDKHYLDMCLKNMKNLISMFMAIL